MVSIKVNSPVPQNIDCDIGIVKPGEKSTDEVPSGITIPQLKPPLAVPTPFIVDVAQLATIGRGIELVKFEKNEPEKYDA